MALIAGPLSGRVWRILDSTPPKLDEEFERALKRYAFRPIKTDQGESRSAGWVNIRQPLDSSLTLNKTLFKNAVALAYRLDRVTLNGRALKAMLAQEISKAVREKKTERLSDEQRKAIEEKVKADMIKNQSPSMSIYELIWKLDTGLVVIGTAGNKINEEIAEYFKQTFERSLEPQVPFTRAERWARKGKLTRELRDLLPTPFSADAPAELIAAETGSEE